MKDYLTLLNIPRFEQKPSYLFRTLEKRVAQCKLCPLSQSRQHTVFGSGSFNAKLVLIGEAPGQQEDQEGLPFVGRAGKLLTNMLEAMGFDRNTVYICNVLKCRPPNNRDPKIEEVNACTPYLEEQLSLLKPALLIALGRHAAHFLLKNDSPLHQLRGKIQQYQALSLPLLVTYHPAYLLRNPSDKGKALQDWFLIKNFLNAF